MKAVIYARVSSDRQEEAGTIASQIDAIQHSPMFAGRELVEVYADDGISGYSKPLWKRPSGARLFQACQEGKLKGVEVWFYRLSRLGRRAAQIHDAVDSLINAGAVVCTLKESYRFDSQTAAWRLVRGIMAEFAEYERNVTVETTRDGMVRKARTGALLPTYARLGYDWSAVNERGYKLPGARLVVNAEEAALVRLIFDKFPEMTLNGLVKWLNGQGCRLPCKSAKLREKYGRTQRLFNAKAVTDIIKNELYTGMVVWGHTTKLQGHQPEEFRHHVPELQIVSFEAFNRANAVMKERRRVPSKSQGSPYVFSGLLRCPECGGKAVGHRMRSHPDYGEGAVKKYSCRAYHQQGKEACKGWAAQETTIMKAVVPFLVDLLENKLRFRERLEEATRQMQWDHRSDGAQQLEGKLAVARRGLAKVQEGWEAGIYTAEEARAKTLEYREIIELVEARLKDLEAVKDMTAELRTAQAILNMPLEEFLATLTEERLARLCRAVFQRFTIRAWGHGWQRMAEIATYELTPGIRQALSEAVHIEPNRPELEIV